MIVVILEEDHPKVDPLRNLAPEIAEEVELVNFYFVKACFPYHWVENWKRMVGESRQQVSVVHFAARHLVLVICPREMLALP